MTNNEVTEGETMSIGALAGIMATMATVKKAMNEATGIKVPHMLYDQLRWIKNNPPNHPLINLGVDKWISRE